MFEDIEPEWVYWTDEQKRIETAKGANVVTIGPSSTGVLMTWWCRRHLATHTVFYQWQSHVEYHRYNHNGRLSTI